MRLLLLSNSTNPGSGYLQHAESWFADFLGPAPLTLAFVPFAGVTISHDAYTARVRDRFEPLGHTVQSVHEAKHADQLLRNADAILVGGGNTFVLLETLYRKSLLDVIRAQALAGTPYIGWSAGSNLAGPTIRTTNDMPIAEPPRFVSLGLVSYQINPHYTDAHPPGHQGETRAQRIAEFTVVNPEVTVYGLPEGTAIRVEEDAHTLIGGQARRFLGADEPVWVDEIAG
ncbi:MAG: dipeptidase PepE [Bacteroidota bacterium]